MVRMETTGSTNMMSPDECQFNGGHRYDGRVTRLPVRFQSVFDPFEPRDCTKPEPIRCWEVQYCTRCGYEKKIARGFDPAKLTG